METTSSKNFEAIFQKIRINFLFNHPFLSVLALSIPSNFTNNAKSAFQTDGAKINIDLEKLSHYSDEEISYLYAHTLLHIVLKHPFRQKTRDAYLWNQSCDLVTNLLLSNFHNIGVKPQDEIVDLDLKDKCVEEVYEILYKEQEDENNESKEEKQEQNAKVEEKPKGKHKTYIYHENKLDIEEVNDEKTHQGEREKIDGIIIQALSLAQKTSNRYAGLQIEIDTLIKPKISLKETLKEYLIASLFEKQTSYARPNRRFVHQGIYLPGYQKSHELLEIYIALDSSSSVTLEEYKKFLGIVEEVCEGYYEYKITLLPFDLKVKSEHIITFDSMNPLQEKELFIPKSDGGTNFDAVLHYLKTTEIRSENLLMVLSDGEFDINENLISETLFIISNQRNLTKFEPYGRVLTFEL